MRQLTLAELLQATAMPDANFKSLRHRGQIALAFGRRDAYRSLSYIELDCLALVLAGTLAKTHSRTLAAQLVRLDGDLWGEAAAMAEARPERPARYVVADFLNADGNLAYLRCVTDAADVDDIARRLALSPLAAGYVEQRISCINVVPLIAFIKTTAAASGIDLTAPWLPAHGSPEFRALFSPYIEARTSSAAKIKNRSLSDDEVLTRAGALTRANAEKAAA